MMLRRWLSTLLGCLFLLACAITRGEETATIRLLAFHRVGEEAEVLVTAPDGKRLGDGPLALPTQQLSAPLAVASRSLAFASPADPTEVLGKVALPAAGSSFILVFLPAPKESATPYQVDPVPLPAGGFGSGDHAFVNYSGANVGCVIDGGRFVVNHGKSAVWHPRRSGGDGARHSIVCYRQVDGAWEDTPFLSTRLIVQDGVRNLILICLDPRTGRIDFRGIADFVEKPADG